MRVGDHVVITYDEPELDLTAGTPGTLTTIRTPEDVDFKTDDGREFTTELSMLEPRTQPSTDDQARDAGLPTPDHWNIAGPHPQEPTWRLPMLKSVTVLHDNHDGVLIDGQWELTTPEELEELAAKLRSAAQWLRRPTDDD